MLFTARSNQANQIAEKKENLGRKFSAGSPSIQIVGTSFFVKSCRLQGQRPKALSNVTGACATVRTYKCVM